MDKSQIISFIQSQLAAGKISPQDLNNLSQNIPITQSVQNPVSIPPKENTSSGLVNTMYIIGALIVAAGVIILTYQHWDEIGFFGRIIVTLGLSAVAFIAALLTNRSKTLLSQVFFTMSAFLAPLGMSVLCSQLNIPLSDIHQALIALILLFVFGLAQVVVWNDILVLLIIAYATWAYYAFLAYLFIVASSNNVSWLQWASVLLGFSYILFGLWYKTTKTASGRLTKDSLAVSNALYGLGALIFLGGVFSLGGIWDFVFIFVIFATFYASVYLKSRATLLFSALFLIAHIFKLTSLYFLSSIGWPVALIFCGFLVVAIGYSTFAIDRKFIQKRFIKN